MEVRLGHVDGATTWRMNLKRYTQGCRGYGYPWIYPWIYPRVDIRLGHPVDISMDIFIYFNSNN